MLTERPLAERRAARAGAWLFRLAAAVALIALSVSALRRLSFRALSDALAATRIPFAAAAAVASFVLIAAKSERWRLMLASSRRLPPLTLYRYLVAAYGAAMVVPGPSGEGLRIYILRKRHGVPVAVSTAVVAIEKLFEGIGLIFVVGALPFALSLPRWVSLLIGALSATGVVVAIAAVLVARRASRTEWKGRWARFASISPSVSCLTTPSTFVRASALSLLAHLIECVAIQLMLTAVGLDLPWATGGLVVLALSFTLLVPLTPGHVGALEAGAVGALQILGVPLEKAMAFALVYHAMQTIPIVLFALTGLGLLSEARAEAARDRAG